MRIPFTPLPTGAMLLLAFACVTGTTPAQLSWSNREVIAPPARVDAAIGYDTQRAESILFGGTDLTKGLRDTRRWDGAACSLLAPATSPSRRKRSLPPRQWATASM